MDAQELAQIAEVRDMLTSGAARELRLAAHVSLSEVAAAAQISTATLWRYENGERVPRAAQALALAPVYCRLGSMVA